jgi:hypothetical protein
LGVGLVTMAAALAKVAPASAKANAIGFIKYPYDFFWAIEAGGRVTRGARLPEKSRRVLDNIAYGECPPAGGTPGPGTGASSPAVSRSFGSRATIIASWFHSACRAW